MITHTLNPPPARRHAITESKKAELDSLTLQVLDAQGEVEQLQAVVTSLIEKSTKFQGFLAAADNDRTHSLATQNLLDSVVQSALDVKNNSAIAFNNMVLADEKTKRTALEIKKMIDKLIYSAEVVNKLSNLVIRKKDINPLISDELISIITSAVKDADNAVALTLVALKATFASQGSSLESEAATALEYTQSIKLYDILTGTVTESNQRIPCLQSMIYQAYSKAQTTYEQLKRANTDTTKQLNNANTDLNKATIKLKSLQSGLAAANAAALAS
jgi:uncharacterized coiled-coil protein SlyX